MAPLSLTSQIMTLIWQHSHLKCQTLLNIAINPDYSPTKQHSHPHFQLWATSYNLLCGCNTKGALPSKQCWLHPVSTTLNSQRNFRSWSWQDCFNHSDRKRSWTANLYPGKYLLIYICLRSEIFSCQGSRVLWTAIYWIIQGAEQHSWGRHHWPAGLGLHSPWWYWPGGGRSGWETTVWSCGGSNIRVSPGSTVPDPEEGRQVLVWKQHPTISIH